MVAADAGLFTREADCRSPDQTARRSGILSNAVLGQNVSDDFAAELTTPDGVQWATETIVDAMCSPQLQLAERLAETFAALRFGSDPTQCPKAAQPPLTLQKLEHDLLQLEHLRSRRSLPIDTHALAEGYAREIDRLRALGSDPRLDLDPGRSDAVAKYYGRVFHVEPGPREPEALSSSWSREQVQRQYRESSHGVVVVDDFLSRQALESLQRFCTSSTVWHGNRYPHGRLGAFFLSGFACPLLTQIAEDLRDGLPNIVGAANPLKQLWGFKYPPQLPAKGSVHADFAAINVNFWISPTDANRDESTGGLIIYEADAPPDWNFDLYNARPDLIEDFLDRHGIRARYIPYRENRAIIFNSDLFHETAQVNFNDDYQTRRVNITMLYGDRSTDNHHANVSMRSIGAIGHSMWRSARAGSWRRR